MNLTARVVRMVSGSAHAIVYMPRSVRRNARRTLTSPPASVPLGRARAWRDHLINIFSKGHR